MKEITIWWEGPFTQDEITNKEIDKTEYDNTADRIGVYQIYGSHPLYGHDVLLYIGKTIDKNGFSSRLKERWEIEEGSDCQNITIYLGTVYSHSDRIRKPEEKEQIDLAEVLLIYALKPAYNSSNIKSVGLKDIEPPYLLNNKNNYKSLYPILSSEYFIQDSDVSQSYIDELAKQYSPNLEIDDNCCGFLIEDDNIFIGVDYECWNAVNVPLQIGVAKTLKKKKLKNIEKEYEKLDYEDSEYIYFSTIDKLDENIEQNIKIIKNQIEQIKSLIQ